MTFLRKDEDWMKKPKRLRVLSGVASVAMLASYLLPLGDLTPVLTAKADDEVTAFYGKPYTIENILTDFGIFSQTDIIGLNHIVGSIAAGGKFESVTSFGDAAPHASYAKTLGEFGNYNVGAYISDEELKEKFKEEARIYYNNDETGFDQYHGNYNYMTKIDNDYINFDEAFREIQKWSDAQKTAPNTWRVKATDIKDGFLDINVVDLAANNILIDKDVYDSLDAIKLHGTPEEVNDANLTFTFDGVKEGGINFGGRRHDGNSLEGQIGVIFDQNSTTFFMGMDREATNTGEANVDVGLSLVWNFPDATSLTNYYQGGHLIAPKADYKITGGQLEGGVIAKRAVIDGEAHFYPYRSLTKIEPSYEFDLYKYIAEDNGEPLANAQFGAFPVGEEGVATNPAYKIKTAAENPNKFGLDAGKYVIKEIKPPSGYMSDGKEYYLEITEDEIVKGAVVQLEAASADATAAPKTAVIDCPVKVTATLYKDDTFTDTEENAEFSPLAINDNTYTYEEKTYAFTVNAEGKLEKVETVNADGQKAPVPEPEAKKFVVTAVKDGEGDSAQTLGYVVACKGEVLKADINLSEKFTTKIFFTNDEAMTLRKVDAADPGKELRGAHFAFVEETYAMDMGGGLPLQKVDPAAPVDGEKSPSREETRRGLVGFTWGVGWEWEDNCVVS